MKRLPDGNLTVVAGRTRSGKTLSTRKAVKLENRLFVFDPKAEWSKGAGCLSVTSVQSFFDLAWKARGGPIKTVLVSSSPSDFLLWASGVFLAGRVGHFFGKKTVVIAEELSSLSNPGKAKGGWHQLLTQGLGFSIDIWCILQRPAECDTTCFGNATRLRCFALTREADRVRMARELDIDVRFLAALKPLEYYERNMLTGVVTKKLA